MAARTLYRLCLLACLLMIDAARSTSAATEKGQTPPGSGRRRSLPTPLIGDDGRLIACSGSDLLAFEPNGSTAWTVPLGHQCNQGIRPVTEQKKVYLVAEDKIIEVTTPDNVGGPASKVFFSYNATEGRSEEIIGLSISGAHWSLFVTIRNRGLFVLSLRWEPQWSIGPVFDGFGYRQGCKGNISACYFDSAPVVHPCDEALYISNTEGQLYSLSIHRRQFRWIQDFSSLDKLMTVSPGKSGRLYVLFPTKSIVVGLDISTGNISWQRNIGPLRGEKTLPTVDSNGWISVGSLDGNLYSISPDGDIRKFLQKAANDSAIHASPVLDCSGFSTYVAQTIVGGKSSHKNGDYTYVSALKKKPKRILFTLLTPATGTIYWTGEWPGELSNLLSNRDLNNFEVDETILLSVLSASRIGNTTIQCYTRRQKIAWTCGHIKANFAETKNDDNDLLRGMMIVDFLVIVIQAAAFCCCCIFWRKKKVQGKGLHKFLEKRSSLHKKSRVLGKMISHLEQTAAEDTSSNETLVRLGEMVKAKEGVENKLYSSYSLGRDRLGLKQDSTVLPQYNGKYKSHSFHSSQKESITVFHTFSDTSASEDGTSSSSDDSGSCSSSATSSEDMELDTIYGSVEEAGPSNTANVADPMFVGGQSTASSGHVLSQREGMVVTLKDYAPSKRMLKRRRTFN